jgi:hypothetical protein
MDPENRRAGTPQDRGQISEKERLLGQSEILALPGEEQSWLAVFYDDENHPWVRVDLAAIEANPEDKIHLVETLQNSLRFLMQVALCDYLDTLAEAGELEKEQKDFLQINWESPEVKPELVRIYLWEKKKEPQTVKSFKERLIGKLPLLMANEVRKRKQQLKESKYEVADRFYWKSMELAQALSGPNNELAVAQNEGAFKDLRTLYRIIPKNKDAALILSLIRSEYPILRSAVERIAAALEIVLPARARKN